MWYGRPLHFAKFPFGKLYLLQKQGDQHTFIYRVSHSNDGLRFVMKYRKLI